MCKVTALPNMCPSLFVFCRYRLATGTVSLSTLEKTAVPLEAALSNQRPTMVEFYAGWCEVCRELTADVYQVS